MVCGPADVLAQEGFLIGCDRPEAVVRCKCQFNNGKQVMAEQPILIIIAVVILLVGFWKAFQPMWWVNLRRRHPWYDKLDFYSFLYKVLVQKKQCASMDMGSLSSD